MVMVSPATSPVPNQCCYSVSLKNLSGNITKICANLPTANWVFNTSMVTTAGYNLQLIGSNTLCITHTSGSIPMGNLPNVFKFCLAETQLNAVSPQLVTFDWYSGMNIVCRDSFKAECRPPVAKDTCLIITELSANCFGENDLEYCMTFQVKNISGAPAYGLVLQNLPLGFTFGNCGCGGNLYGANGWLFDWLATPLANNATRTVCVKIISITPILSPKNVCFNATLDIAPNCCTAPKDWCVTLKPCCNPCEKISVAVNNRDSCCYSLDFKYDCDYQVFTKIEFDILTPGVSFGSHAHNSAWSLCNVPTLTNVCILPPLGTMPSGVFNNLFSFCLTDINSPLEIPQQVKIKYWMLGSNGQDSLACDTILRFNCGYTQKPCVFITDEKIECFKDSMKYKITVTVKNLSSPSFTAYNLMFIGSGLTPNPVPLIPPLPNDGTVRTVTFCYTPTPWPDATAESNR